MPNWFYEKKDLRNNPSVKSGVCDYETELRYRREGARFIQELGRALGLAHDAIATGSVYFHRFYMFHTFADFPRYVTAACALFLAGKAEETPKKLRDLQKTVRSLTNDEQFATFGKDPREEILTLERVLLQTLKFDLQISHPYTSLIKFAKCLKGDSAKLQKMVQMSWTFINDSLCTTLCLQWEPEIIAIALMHLSGKLSKFNFKDWNNKTPDHKHWWDQYVQLLRIDVLEDICHQVLDLYSLPNSNIESPLKPIPSKLPQSTPPDSSRISPQYLPYSQSRFPPDQVLTCPAPRKPGSPSGSLGPPTRANSTPGGFYMPDLPKGYPSTPFTHHPSDGNTPYPFREIAQKADMNPLWNNNNNSTSSYHDARQSGHKTDMSPPLSKQPHLSHGNEPVFTSDMNNRVLGVHLTSTPVSRCPPPLFGRGSHREGLGRESHADNSRRGGDFGRDRDDSKEGWGQRGVSRARSFPRPHQEGRRGFF